MRDKNPKHGYFQCSCSCVVNNAYNESTVQRHGRELLMEGSLLSASENEERKKKRHSEHMRGICGKSRTGRYQQWVRFGPWELRGTVIKLGV